MNYQNQTRALIETSLIGVIGAMLSVAFAGINVPIMSLFTVIWPVPFIILGAKRGLRYCFLSIIISTTLTFFIINQVAAITLFFTFALTAIAMAYSMKNRYSAVKTLAIGMVGWLLSSVMVIYIFSTIIEVNLVNEIKESIRVFLEYNINALGLGEQGEDYVRLFYDAYLLIIPSVMFLFSLFVSFVNLILSTVILNRLGVKVDTLPSFDHWRMPDNVNIGIIVLMVMTYLLKLMNIPYYETVMSNLIVIFTIGFLIQGVAIVAFWLKKLRVKQVLIFIIVGIMMVAGFFVIPLVILGMLDVAIDIRKLRRRRIK